MRKGFFPLLTITLFLAVLMVAQTPQKDYKAIYAYAEKLYSSPEPTEKTDSIALHAYMQVIKALEGTGLNDSILMDSYFKAGIFKQTYARFDEAIPLLRNCVSIIEKSNNKFGEAAFLPQLYLGNSYYTVNRFDSARYFYTKAEEVTKKFPGIQELERLYNAFGILNFETGNYRQSKNNFEKAISVLDKTDDSRIAFLVNYKSNLASSLRKLYEYDAAMAIYTDLLKYKINTDEINQNIASIFLQIGASPQAIKYLHAIKTTSIWKYNDLGLAHYNQKAYDSASWYFEKASSLNHTQNANKKNVFAGITYRYMGDLKAAQHQWDKALIDYQKAINQLIYFYNDSSIENNPNSYSGVFAVTELYETLLAKATAFRALFDSTKDIRSLESSIKTFRSLYQLTDYVEKTYESDEARIFLNQKKYGSHHIPIDICLQLYKLTKKENYLDEAFYFDEKNKASVLVNGLLEKELKKAVNIPESLLAEESNCKENINRLSLKAAAISDSAILSGILTQLREQELKLESLSKKFAENPAYNKLHFEETTISFSELQQKIIPENGAILSYHMGDSSILCWVITKEEREMFELPKTDSLIFSIHELSTALEKNSSNDNMLFRRNSHKLYDQLIQPLANKLNDYSQLMIIPDDELSYIPFEMLLDENDKYLLNNFAISYNYACSLLKKEGELETRSSNSILAFAPYSDKVNNSPLAPLPASEEEVSNLGGTFYLSKAATKQIFLKDAGNYNILHLATHAQANDKEPLQSYIAFYPQHPDSPSLDQVYLPDIYSLQLTKTHLAILSACETGGGQLIKGEGIISLSRAFSYAGCANMITSQWKADDAATSYITQRLHYYLKDGYSIATSLQKGKMDYLADQKIEGRNKTAAYWAHLRLTGQFAPDDSKSKWWWLLLIPALLIVYLSIKKFRLQ